MKTFAVFAGYMLCVVSGRSDCRLRAPHTPRPVTQVSYCLALACQKGQKFSLFTGNDKIFFLKKHCPARHKKSISPAIFHPTKLRRSVAKAQWLSCLFLLVLNDQIPRLHLLPNIASIRCGHPLRWCHYAATAALPCTVHTSSPIGLQ